MQVAKALSGLHGNAGLVYAFNYCRCDSNETLMYSPLFVCFLRFWLLSQTYSYSNQTQIDKTGSLLQTISFQSVFTALRSSCSGKIIPMTDASLGCVCVWGGGGGEGEGEGGGVLSFFLMRRLGPSTYCLQKLGIAGIPTKYLNF